jgi:hypothetical protein
MGGGRCIGLGAILLIGCAGCDNVTLAVLESHRVPSPDKSLEATVERVHNGLGIGASAIFYEIHVQRAGSPVLEHGDPGDSVLFYVMQDTNTDVPVTASWIGPRRLVITYDGRRTPGRIVRQLGDIAVDYSPVIQP